MEDTLKVLTEEKATLVRSREAVEAVLTTENREVFTPDEEKNWDDLTNKITNVNQRIETKQRLIRSASESVKPTGVHSIQYKPTRDVEKRDVDLALRGWMLASHGHQENMSRSMAEACEKLGVNMQAKSISRTGLGIGTATAGAELANGTIFGGLDKALKYYSGVRQVARIMNLPQGTPLVFAKSTDVANVASIVAEHGDTPENDETTSSITFGAKTYRSGVFPVSIEMVQDSAVDLNEFIGEDLGIRIARGENADFTNLTSGPHGVSTRAADSGVTAASTTVWTWQELNQIKHSVDLMYRSMPGCGWMYSDSTALGIESIVDDNGRPILNSSLDGVSGGFGQTLLGFPVTINNDMPACTAGLKSILFGNFQKYVIRDVGQPMLRVYDQVLSETADMFYQIIHRTYGDLVDAGGAVKYGKMHA